MKPMKKTIQLLSLTFAAVVFSPSLLAQTHTAPVGYLIYAFPSTVSQTTSYISAPLKPLASYTGKPTTVGTNTLTDTTATWTSSQFVQTSGGVPYYVVFTSGLQKGRALKITANTTTVLTLDVTDNSTQTTNLNATSFAVTTSDSYEIVAGYTLSSFFGTTGVLSGGTDVSSADNVGLWNSQTSSFDYYYYNTNLSHWVKSTDSNNSDAGDTILPPSATMAIVRQSGRSASQLVLTGRAPAVALLLKSAGGSVIRYYGMYVPVDMTFSQISLGSNWTKSDSVFTADTLSIYNSTTSVWETYYQRSSDSVWRKVGDSNSQNSTIIPAGSAVAFLKRASVTGSTSFFPLTLPYTP